MIVHPVEFLQRVRALCSRREVLLFADEVLTGFGRTGKMFACDLANVVPDLMCISKGITGGFLPMGAALCSDRVELAFRSENRAHTFYHGHSYTGNALACAAANENLRIFDDEPVFDRISAIARIHGERLGQLREMHQNRGHAANWHDRRAGIVRGGCRLSFGDAPQAVPIFP